MGDSFFAYLQQLELIAFFSGYPLIYAATFSFFGKQQSKRNFNTSIVSLLPLAYALVGTLYLGLQLKNLYPNYSFENIKQTVQLPYLMAWGLLSILFWIPALSKKIFLSLIHSLVFFFFLVKDIFTQLSLSTTSKDVIKNDMKLYTVSLLLNMSAVALILLISFLFNYNRKRLKS